MSFDKRENDTALKSYLGQAREHVNFFAQSAANAANTQDAKYNTAARDAFAAVVVRIELTDSAEDAHAALTQELNRW